MKLSKIQTFSIENGRVLKKGTLEDLASLTRKLLGNLTESLGADELAQAGNLLRQLERKAGITGSTVAAASALPVLQARAHIAQEKLDLQAAKDALALAEAQITDVDPRRIFLIDHIRDGCIAKDFSHIREELELPLEEGNLDAIKASLKRICEKRVSLQDTLLGFAQQTGAMTTSNQLVYKLVMQFCKPATIRELLAILLPHLTHTYEHAAISENGTITKFRKVAIKDSHLSLLDGPIPKDSSLFKSLIVEGNTALLVADVALLNYPSFKVLYHFLEENNPALGKQLFSHNLAFLKLREAFQQAPSLGEAIAVFTDMLSKNGESYSGHRFSTDKAKDEFDLFVTYWNKFPQEVHRSPFGKALQTILNRIDQDKCIEQAARDLAELLARNIGNPELSQTSNFSIQAAKNATTLAKQLRRAKKEPLDTLRTGASVSALPASLVKYVIPAKINEIQLLDDLLRAVPIEFYPLLIERSDKLAAQLPQPHPGLSAEQQEALNRNTYLIRLDTMTLDTYLREQNAIISLILGADNTTVSQNRLDPENWPVFLQNCSPDLFVKIWPIIARGIGQLPRELKIAAAVALYRRETKFTEANRSQVFIEDLRKSFSIPEHEALLVAICWEQDIPRTDKLKLINHRQLLFYGIQDKILPALVGKDPEIIANNTIASDNLLPFLEKGDKDLIDALGETLAEKIKLRKRTERTFHIAPFFAKSPRLATMEILDYLKSTFTLSQKLQLCVELMKRPGVPDSIRRPYLELCLADAKWDQDTAEYFGRLAELAIQENLTLPFLESGACTDPIIFVSFLNTLSPEIKTGLQSSLLEILQQELEKRYFMLHNQIDTTQRWLLAAGALFNMKDCPGDTVKIARILAEHLAEEPTSNRKKLEALAPYMPKEMIIDPTTSLNAVLALSYLGYDQNALLAKLTTKKWNASLRPIHKMLLAEGTTKVTRARLIGALLKAQDLKAVLGERVVSDAGLLKKKRTITEHYQNEFGKDVLAGVASFLKVIDS